MPKNSRTKVERWPVWFSSERSTTDQIFTLKQIFEKSWEYAKDVFARFADLKKAYNRVPRDKLWKVLQEYGIGEHLLVAIKSLYCQPDVCVLVNGKQLKSFYVGVGFRQGYVLSPLLFIICVNWKDIQYSAEPMIVLQSIKSFSK